MQLVLPLLPIPPEKTPWKDDNAPVLHHAAPPHFDDGEGQAS